VWQLPYGFEYEFGREACAANSSFNQLVTEVRHAYREHLQAVRKRLPDEKYAFTENGAGAWLAFGQRRVPLSVLWELVLLFDEFPQTPWLSIPADRRIEKLNAAYGSWRHPDSQKHKALVADEGPLQAEELSVEGENIEENGVAQDSRTTWRGASAVSYYVIRVDWGLRDSALKKQYLQFLTQHRPKDAEDAAIEEKRGEHTERDSLKLLGAKRLLDRMTWQQAEIETLKHLRDKSGNHKPLYTGRTHWIDARRKARQLLSDFIAKRQSCPG
jgi:uncharacterized small protein (DUF1192 family)